MTYKAIIFDWDGTLMDSAQRIIDSMVLACADVGLAQKSDHDIRQIIGLGLPEAILHLWSELATSSAELNEMKRLYEVHYVSDERPAMPLFQYAQDLLEQLRRDGYRLAVATGKSRRGLNKIFDEHQLGHMFCDSRCADETKSKPNPLMLEELSVALDVQPGDMLMVGDTLWDLHMANNAGVDSVGITHGAHSKDKLKTANPRALVDDLLGLHGWIQS